MRKGRPEIDGRVQWTYGFPAPIRILLGVPVPWVFVLDYLVGVGIQFVAPLPIHTASILQICQIAGFALMFCGLALAATCLGLFRAVRTTTIPGEASRDLVVSGHYRLSRNPMYVSLTMMYLGEAGMLGQIWPLLTLPLVLVYLNRVVIPVEEARLRAVFGEVYDQYSARVRRWV